MSYETIELFKDYSDLQKWYDINCNTCTKRFDKGACCAEADMRRLSGRIQPENVEIIKSSDVVPFRCDNHKRKDIKNRKQREKETDPKQLELL